MKTVYVKNNKVLKELTAEVIIQEIKNGKIEYFSEIVRRYNQRLYRIAVSYGVYDNDAEEVIQLAYISAYEKLNQFRGKAKFSTWLIRILINECLMFKRKKKKFINFEEDKAVTILFEDHLNPEKSYMEKERKELLENAIKQLPDIYKSVYMFKEVEGMSIEETSAALNITKINVKVRLHRAKAMLKKLIQDSTDVSSLFTFGNDRCDRINDNVMDYIRKKNLAYLKIPQMTIQKPLK